MNAYTIYIEGLGREVTVVANTEKEAYHEAFRGLEDFEQDRVACLDCIEVAPVAAAIQLSGLLVERPPGEMALYGFIG